MATVVAEPDTHQVLTSVTQATVSHWLGPQEPPRECGAPGWGWPCGEACGPAPAGVPRSPLPVEGVRPHHAPSGRRPPQAGGPPGSRPPGLRGAAHSRLGRLEALASSDPRSLSHGPWPHSASGPRRAVSMAPRPPRHGLCPHVAPGECHPVCTLGVLRAVLALPGLAAKRSASSSLELLRFRTRRVGTAAPLLPVTFARGSDLCLRFCRPRPGVHHGTALMCSHIQWRAGPCDSRVDASVSPVGPRVGQLHGVLEVSHPEPCEQVGARWQGAGVGGTSARPLSQRASAD